MAEPVVLYAFEYLCPLRKRWVRARYKAEVHEIAARYAEFETIGPPEIRHPSEQGEYFNPHRGRK